MSYALQDLNRERKTKAQKARCSACASVAIAACAGCMKKKPGRQNLLCKRHAHFEGGNNEALCVYCEHERRRRAKELEDKALTMGGNIAYPK